MQKKRERTQKSGHESISHLVEISTIACAVLVPRRAVHFFFFLSFAGQLFKPWPVPGADPCRMCVIGHLRHPSKLSIWVSLHLIARKLDETVKFALRQHLQQPNSGIINRALLVNLSTGPRLFLETSSPHRLPLPLLQTMLQTRPKKKTEQ